MGLVQVGISVSEKLVFKSENLYYDALKDAIAEGEKPPRKGKSVSLSHLLGKNSNLFHFSH